MARAFFHIDYRPRITWLFPIYNRLNSTPSARLKAAYSKWEVTELPELALALATKFAVFLRVVDRFNSDYGRLLAEISKDEGRIRKHISTGTVWTIRDDELLPFDLIAGIDAFIFEARSTYEILGKFVTALFALLFDRPLTEKDLKKLLHESGLDVTWTLFLQEERKLFFHNTSPWIAVALSDSSETPYELIILRRNAKTLDKPEDFARLSEYNEIFVAFMQALDRLSDYIVGEIDKFERDNE